MIRQQLIVQNKLGLHVRAAAKLVDTAKKFSSRIELIYRERAVDCKSIMSVITLGAQKSDGIEIIITGLDEQEAFAEINKLFSNKFGEE